MDVVSNREKLKSLVGALKERGIGTSMFIDPDPAQIEVSKKVGSDCVELHTG